MHMTAVEIRDLVVKVDGYPIVNGLTLIIEEGERVGIVGDSRDALSVMNTLCGFTLPDSGEIWVYNLPSRQALQRGLISCTSQSTLDAPPIPVLLIAHSRPLFQPHSNVVIHSLPPIGSFDELIHNNYKFINLNPERRNVSL